MRVGQIILLISLALVVVGLSLAQHLDTLINGLLL